MPDARSLWDPDFAETREEIRTRLASVATELHDAERIAEGMKTDDLDLAARVKSLGFDGDSARVFDLLPMLHVAWADGRIQAGERASIMEVLELRQLGPETRAYQMIAALLEKRPADVWFEVSAELLRELFEKRPWNSRALVDLCVMVAEASGSFLGLGDAISNEERQALGRIAKTLGPEAYSAFVSRLGDGPAED